MELKDRDPSMTTRMWYRDVVSARLDAWLLGAAVDVLSYRQSFSATDPLLDEKSEQICVQVRTSTELAVKTGPHEEGPVP